MRVIIHGDGAIEFPDGVPEGMLLYTFAPDLDRPNFFVPKFLPCTYRQNKCRQSACKLRVIFDWRCTHFHKSVGVKDCENCNARKEQ